MHRLENAIAAFTRSAEAAGHWWADSSTRVEFSEEDIHAAFAAWNAELEKEFRALGQDLPGGILPKDRMCFTPDGGYFEYTIGVNNQVRLHILFNKEKGVERLGVTYHAKEYLAYDLFHTDGSYTTSFNEAPGRVWARLIGFMALLQGVPYEVVETQVAPPHDEEYALYRKFAVRGMIGHLLAGPEAYEI